jgi:hypothetical protein
MMLEADRSIDRSRPQDNETMARGRIGIATVRYCYKIQICHPAGRFINSINWQQKRYE